MRIGIIGGGASGMILASKLSGYDVTILERNNKLGKKLCLTGNGKCNYTNLDFNDLNYIYNNEFARNIYRKFDNISFIEYFKKIGIVPKIEVHKGISYVYPNTGSALSVYYCLYDKIVSNKVNIIYNAKVVDIKKDNEIFKVNIENGNEYIFDKLVIATGGKSYQKTGSDGSGYELAKKLGHNITNLAPGLCKIKYKINSNHFNDIKNFRINAKVGLDSLDNDKIILDETGEIQFTEKWLSGIPIMNLSNKIGRDIEKGISYKLKIDFSYPLFENLDNGFIIKKDTIVNDTSYRDFDKKVNYIKEILLERKNNNKYRNIKYFLSGFLPDDLSMMIYDKVGINANDLNVNDITDKEIEIILRNIVGFCVSINGRSNFDDAQITLGGVDVDEVNNDTLESKIVNNLYFTGEILDIDGICGGYNLQLAYSTASIVAESL